MTSGATPQSPLARARTEAESRNPQPKAAAGFRINPLSPYADLKSKYPSHIPTIFSDRPGIAVRMTYFRRRRNIHSGWTGGIEQKTKSVTGKT
jgi:hypothetical protein